MAPKISETISYVLLGGGAQRVCGLSDGLLLLPPVPEGGLGPTQAAVQADSRPQEE